MARLYIDDDSVRFIRKDITLVDMEFYDGRKFEDLEPRRLFPRTGLGKYITLLDSEGEEKAIIRNLENLLPESKKIIEECLDEFYLIPKVTKINKITIKSGTVKIDVETNKGQTVIETRNILHGIKRIYGTRVLFRDSDDNRYEILDMHQLDKRSRRLIEEYL
ncbi:MAG: DUF1854 domain-containing protein [Oscillospiraceae bacterium]|nr:DUF1854 domain-containing protein [Oscillospiraceae bacterium]